MSRVMLAALVGWACCTSAGCTMCASPYDYCGPVVSEGGACGEECCIGAPRRNSILSSPVYAGISEDEVIYEGAQTTIAPGESLHGQPIVTDGVVQGSSIARIMPTQQTTYADTPTTVTPPTTTALRPDQQLYR